MHSFAGTASGNLGGDFFFCVTYRVRVSPSNKVLFQWIRSLACHNFVASSILNALPQINVACVVFLRRMTVFAFQLCAHAQMCT